MWGCSFWVLIGWCIYMAKNIIIQEGGIGKQLTVNTLKTNLVGGGTCLWVPEDERQLGTKHITENGTYRANDDGYYGYSEVTVNGVGSVTGRDPTTGDEVEVHRDPDTGEIVQTVIPTEIRVITPPTNPYGTYVDGQTITKDGMVVKAYSSTGAELQTVLIGEITINPTTAVYDESKDTAGTGTATSNLETALQQPINYGKRAGHRMIDGSYDQYVEAEAVASYLANDGKYMTIFASSRTPCGTIYTSDRQGTSTHSVNGSDYTYDGKTVYFDTTVYNNGGSWEGYGQLNTYNGTGFISNDAWTMIYGDRHENPHGSTQTINVSWPRPGDGAILETSFEILVDHSAGQGDD